MQMIGQRDINRINCRIFDDSFIGIIHVADIVFFSYLFGSRRRASSQGVDDTVARFLNCRDDAFTGNQGIAQHTPFNLIRHPAPPIYRHFSSIGRLLPELRRLLPSPTAGPRSARPTINDRPDLRETDMYLARELTVLCG